jgi:hypothetical protein
MPDNDPSHSRSDNGASSWTFGRWRKPKEPEARNIVLDDIYPSEPSCGGSKKVLLLGTAAVVVVVAMAVVLVVFLSKGSPSPSSHTSPSLPPVNSSPSPMRPSLPPATGSPTDAPSVLDTFPPTLEPTSQLALMPTDAPTAIEVTQRFIDGLPQYSLKLAAADASSPQAKALDWLQKDPLYDKYENVYRLNQRYALAVLYYSTNGASWNNRSGWLSNTSECLWYIYDDPGSEDDDKCPDDSRLSILDMDGNGLAGTIPTELELLTDLQELAFSHDEATLSVAIYTEL